jgi:hypothetical protein
MIDSFRATLGNLNLSAIPRVLSGPAGEEVIPRSPALNGTFTRMSLI